MLHSNAARAPRTAGRVIPRIPSQLSDRALQWMQFSTHNMAWKTSITYFSVVIETFRVDAQAAVNYCGLDAPGVDGVTIS